MRTAALVLLLVSSALAGPKAPRCVKTSKEAVEIARTRGKLIFLTVIVDNDGENRAVIDNVFRDRTFLKIAKEFVILVPLTAAVWFARLRNWRKLGNGGNDGNGELRE